ncbi:hypothetical protein CRE_20892 [Caenorhabditis remanei]|uniref:Uncharacterized protein n=1 Tax=Caenorhabditis remanei TaxID=31234 RepID=E3MV55_CAERE|nr:hypothetical protein CRE_20892 [Caenorhabditis remanei]
MASTSEKKTEEEMVNEPPAKKMKETSQEPEWLQYFNKDKVVINKYRPRQARILKKQDEDIMSDPDYQVILTQIYKSNYIRSQEMNTLLQIQENFLDEGVFNKEELEVKENEEEEKIVEEEEDPIMKELQKKIDEIKDKIRLINGESRRNDAEIAELEKTPGVGVPGVSYKKNKHTKGRAKKMMESELKVISQYFAIRDNKLEAEKLLEEAEKVRKDMLKSLE